MSKSVKWIIGIVFFLIVLIIVIPLLIPLFIDPNDYKDTIAQKVEEQTGRTLSIPGDIELDFSLIGLNTVFKLGEVRMSSSQEFAGTDFFSSNHVEINLAVWPLLKDKELVVNKIGLEGVTINLVKNEAGKGSWEDLAGGTAQKATEQKKEPSEKTGGGLSGIDIGGIQAKNINLTYVDKQADRTIKLGNLNLETGRIRQNNPFPLKSSFELFVQNPGQDPLSAEFNLGTNFTFSLAEQHYVIEDLTFNGLVKNSSIAPGKIDFDISADIDLALKKENINIKELIVRQGQMQIETVLAVTGFAQPQIKGTVRIPRFSPRNQAESFGISLPTEDPQSLSNMSAQVDFSGNPEKLDISNITLNLDDTKVTGKASLTDLKQPVYNLDLHIDQFDLDRYAMKKETGSGTEKPPAPTAKQTSPPSTEEEQAGLPVDQLRNLNFDAAIEIGKFKAAKLNMANMRVNATGKNGLIKLNPFAADLYEGKITVTADIDARQDIPTIQLNKKLQGVQLGPMFIDMTGKEEIKGRADIQAEITTKGEDSTALKENANGTMSVSLADGEIAKLKIIDTIRAAKALMGSKDEEQKQSAGEEPSREEQPPKPKAEPAKSTTFASLKATGVITNGVFNNNDLLAESELMRVEGQGTVDFVHEQIDYLLTIYLAKSIDRDKETGLVELADTPIPYRVKGTFDKIAQSAALEEIIKSEAKKLLLNELQKQFGGDETKKQQDGENVQQEGEQQKSADPTKDLIKKGFKSLFGN